MLERRSRLVLAATVLLAAAAALLWLLRSGRGAAAARERRGDAQALFTYANGKLVLDPAPVGTIRLHPQPDGTIEPIEMPATLEHEVTRVLRER